MSVSVCIKDVKDGVHQVGTQVRSRAHKHRPLEILLGDGLVSVCVHLHGDAEVIKCIQELTELPELLERNSLFAGGATPDSFDTLLDVGAVQHGVPQQDPGKVFLGYGGQSPGKLQELQLYHL